MFYVAAAFVKYCYTTDGWLLWLMSWYALSGLLTARGKMIVKQDYCDNTDYWCIIQSSEISVFMFIHACEISNLLELSHLYSNNVGMFLALHDMLYVFIIKSPRCTGVTILLYRFVWHCHRRLQTLVHAITFEQLFVGFLSVLAWLLALTYRLPD